MAVELDFVGVGSSRSGTTWMARVLDAHPSVYLPPDKELHYFHDDDAYSPDLAGLAERFPEEKQSRLFGEYTPRYYLYRRALERIERAFPDVRILFSLRDPVDRAFSQYRYFRFNKQKEYIPDFIEALEGPFREDYVTKSLYHGPLTTMRELFGESRILLVFFEQIRNDPSAVAKQLYDFLAVDPEVTVEDLTRPRNPSRDDRDLTPFRRSLYALRRTGRRLTDRLGLTDLLRPPAGIVVSLLEAVTRGSTPREAPLRLDHETRATVYERYFREDVEKLRTTVDRDLSDWVPGE